MERVDAAVVQRDRRDDLAVEGVEVGAGDAEADDIDCGEMREDQEVDV